MPLSGFLRAAAAAGLLALAACSAVALNEPLSPEQLAPEGAPTITDGGYRLASMAANDGSSEMIVILALSGGGARSAALSLGVAAHDRRRFRSVSSKACATRPSAPAAGIAGCSMRSISSRRYPAAA